jgi:hypothetical protein
MLFLSKSLKAILPAMALFLGIFGTVAFGGDIFQYDSDISGKIVDYDTRKPMEGVVVSCVWFYERVRFSEAPKREFYDYFETLTDQDGRFMIPGKGLCIIRNIYPPAITIFKAGYSILQLPNLVLNSTQDLPSGDEVKWVDGKAIIHFRKKPLEERIMYLQSHSMVPLFQMMHDDITSEKVRLYVRELEKEYEAADMMMNNQRSLQYKKGRILPAMEDSLKPKSIE